MLFSYSWFNAELAAPLEILEYMRLCVIITPQETTILSVVVYDYYSAHAYILDTSWYNMHTAHEMVVVTLGLHVVVLLSV